MPTLIDVARMLHDEFPKEKAMKKVALATVLVLALSPIFVFAAGKPDFTGTWLMDKTRTEGVPTGVEQTMTLTQTDDRLVLLNKISTDAGENIINDTYIINGKEVEFTQKVNEQESKGKRTSKWTADGRGFDVTEAATIERGNGAENFKVMRHWRLSDDGKTLTIEMIFDEPGGPGKSKRVFVKQ